MENIQTFTSFRQTKPEIEELQNVAKVDPSEVSLEDEAEKVEDPDEFLQNIQDNSAANEISMDSNEKRHIHCFKEHPVSKLK